MQQIAAVAGKRLTAGTRQTAAIVQRIAYQRMTRGREVDADLVRASRVDPYRDETRPVLRAHRPHERARRPAVGARRVYGAEERVRDRTDRDVDRKTTTRQPPLDQATVRACHLPHSPRAREASPCALTAREQHHARGAAAEAVHRDGTGKTSAHRPEERVREEAASG